MKKTPKKELKFEEVIESLDLSLINDAIRKVEEGEPEIPEDGPGIRDLRERIYEAAKKWLIRDLNTLRDPSFEKKFLVPVGATQRETKGFIDMSATVRDDVTGKPFVDYKGKVVIVDWKTTKNSLGTDWKYKLLDSWQGKLYAHVGGASIFSYRGVSRNGELKEILFEPAGNNSELVQIQVDAVTYQQKALIDSGLEVYARNMPKACTEFGKDYPCPFLDDCLSDAMPKKALTNLRPLSYSRMERFMSCAERHRREQIILEEQGEREEGSEASLFGKAFHRGVAETWAQAFKRYGNF